MRRTKTSQYDRVAYNTVEGTAMASSQSVTHAVLTTSLGRPTGFANNAETTAARVVKHPVDTVPVYARLQTLQQSRRYACDMWRIKPCTPERFSL